MPVYGKGRSGRKVKMPFGKGRRDTRLRKNSKILRDIEGREMFEEGSWSVHKSRITRIEKTLKFGVQREIAGRIAKGERPVVLDWGCGTGRAIVNLASRFPQISAIGFSDISYGQWKGTNKAKFIHDTKERLLRLVKNGSVDVIYSHSALSQIGGKMQEYLLELLPKLKKKGLLATDHAVCIAGPVELPESFAIGEMRFSLERTNSKRTLIFRRVK